jgi:hypothetical protein
MQSNRLCTSAADVERGQGEGAGASRPRPNGRCRLHGGSPVLGTSLFPAELAKTVAQSRDRSPWFSDRPPSFTAELELSEADIAAARNARTATALMSILMLCFPHSMIYPIP